MPVAFLFIIAPPSTSPHPLATCRHSFELTSAVRHGRCVPGHRIAGWKRIVQGVIKLFIDGDFVAHWNQFDFVITVHRFPFNPSSNRLRCLELIRLLESLVHVILGDARSRIALLVQILLFGAITHHARMRGICLLVCRLRFRFRN